MKTLFLFTKTYPYGHGEQYITDELKFTAQVFEKIIIYPNDYYGHDAHHDKELPANVEILNFNKSLGSKAKTGFSDYAYLLKNTLHELAETDDKVSFFRNFKWNLVNFWTQYLLANNMADYLKTHNYNASNAVFYSYWFHKSVILLSVLKDKKYISNFVARGHSIDVYHHDWGIIHKDAKVPSFKLFKLRHVSKLWTVSKHGYDYLVKKFPAYAQNFGVSYLGVKKEGEPGNKITGPLFHIVTCSGIDANKRVHVLAHALAELKQPVQWTHFGSGHYKQEVEHLVAKFPAGSHVDLKGNVPNVTIKNFYRENHVDLFVNLSKVEGLPVSIMEALSYHIPVLATAVYGTPEAVIEGKNGFLIDVDFSMEILIAKLEYCMAHPDALKKMHDQSYHLFEERFNALKNYSEFADYLRSL